MKYHYDIAPIISAETDTIRRYLGSSKYFNEHILSHEEVAMKVWRSVMRRFANKESDYSIPYHLAESMKLYAVDALVVTAPLVKDRDDIFKMAEFFSVFYLLVHYFDDHVEHRDKFYSKFDFDSTENIDTQRGAAPFSFMFVTFDVLYDILGDIQSLSVANRAAVMHEVSVVLARQTQYFAAERQGDLDIEQTLEMKQRQVAGKSLAFYATLVSAYLKHDAQEAKDLYDGLMYLGSMTQITDDIRDQSIDHMLRNANIVLLAHRMLGMELGNERLNAVFDNELRLTKKYLQRFYSEDAMTVICSLPFYPFMIDKKVINKK